MIKEESSLTKKASLRVSLDRKRKEWLHKPLKSSRKVEPEKETLNKGQKQTLSTRNCWNI